MRVIRPIQELKKADYLTISELAELKGVRYSTVKYYTELGLLPYKQKGEGLTRRYPREKASKRLNEILELKEKRFTIDEITDRLKK